MLPTLPAVLIIELLMMLRSRKKFSREVSLYEPIGTDKEGNEIHLLDIVEANEQDITDQCIHKERILQLYGCLREVLSPLEYEVIKYRYGLFGEKELTQLGTWKTAGNQPFLCLPPLKKMLY